MTPISVVMPCHNPGKNLAEAVQSVLRQSRPAAEIIIVNDGSTDDETLRLLEAYEQQGIIVFHTPNRGAWAARNYGVSSAKSPYTLCFDSDDVLMPTFLEKTAQRLDAMPQVGVAATHLEYFGARNFFRIPRDYAPSRMLWENCLPSGSLFRKRCWEEVGGYKDLKACEDWEFWISVTVERGWQWVVVPEVLYRYRKQAGSLSESYQEANRPELTRQIIQLHQTTYQSVLVDIIVDLNTPLKSSGSGVKQYAWKPQVNTQARQELWQALNEKQQQPHKKNEHDERIGQIVQATIPRDAVVLLVRDDKEDRFDLGLKNVVLFPQNEKGFATGDGGNASIARLEKMRRQGAEFLLLDSPALAWLESQPELYRHLLHRYRAAARRENACLIFDLGKEMEQHTFSVVICTYKRAHFLEQAIASVFAQNYPKDKYEIIIIDNDSPDDTEEVIRRCAARSPAAFSSYLEKRNGISFCRNLGVEKSRHEFVAFLDDDETASQDWLATFNAVINEHHALVVCGRVERAFEPDLVPPQWFNSQYLKGFFSLNYRARGRNEKVFRIRYPDYFGTGNSAYAKRLFAHFGGFDVRLGRDGKTLRSGEDTYFNWVLDRNNIPTYYSDEAYINHFVETSRLTKSYLRRKCYWSGVTNALIDTRLLGCDAALQKTKNGWKKIWEKARLILRHPHDPENFGHFCSMIYQFAYLRRFYPIYLRHKLKRERHAPPQATWSSEHWLAEVSRWPEGPEKHRELYQYHLFREDEENAQKNLDNLAAYLGLADREQVARLLEAGTIMNQRQHYEVHKQQIRQIVNANLPEQAKVLVVSKGDEELLQFEGRRGWHFPQTGKNVYAGYYPANGADAIVHLEELRRKGADFLLFPSVAFWWLDHYTELAAHLEKRYKRMASPDGACLIYDLRNPAIGKTNGASSTLRRPRAYAAPTNQRGHYDELKQNIRQIVNANLPDQAKVLVVSKGDEELLQFEGRRGWHFPQTGKNVYAGYYPANSAEAIAHLEELRCHGADFLLFPQPAFWWLDHYADFKAHLKNRYGLLLQQEGACLIYDLRNSNGHGKTP
jgi:glycosyltransferase involved in cell wall biosynthesis